MSDAEARMTAWVRDTMTAFEKASHRPAVDAAASRFAENRKWLASNRRLTFDMLTKVMDTAYERVKSIPIPPREGATKEAA